jgi:hypothetical protein
MVARKRFELLSRAPEAPMLGHYTTGLHEGDIRTMKFYVITLAHLFNFKVTTL